MATHIPMSSPDIGDTDVQAVVETLHMPTLSIGPRLAAFEHAAAAVAGVDWEVGVNSGAGGLRLCVIAAGVGDGDLVITTPFSFIASANYVLYERSMPVFVDVDPATGNIDLHLAVSASVMTEAQVDAVCEELRNAVQRSVSLPVTGGAAR